MARIVNGGRVTIHDVQRISTTSNTLDTSHALSRAVDLNQAYLITLAGDTTRGASSYASGNRKPFTLSSSTTVQSYTGNCYGGGFTNVTATAEVVEYFQ